MPNTSSLVASGTVAKAGALLNKTGKMKEKLIAPATLRLTRHHFMSSCHMASKGVTINSPQSTHISTTLIYSPHFTSHRIAQPMSEIPNNFWKFLSRLDAFCAPPPPPNTHTHKHTSHSLYHRLFSFSSVSLTPCLSTPVFICLLISLFTRSYISIVSSGRY